MTDFHSGSVPVAVWILLAGMMLSPSAGAQDRGRFLRWVYQDAGTFFTDVAPRIPLYTLSATTFLMAVSPQDQPVLESIQEGYEGLWGTYLDVTNEIGSPLGVIPLFGLFEISLLSGDAKFQDASFTTLQAWVYTGLLVTGFKTVLGRSRPETGEGPRTYGFFSGGRAYPSGHTAAAFAIVTTWALYYPGIATYSLYLLSAGTAVARVAKNKHWPTDVIAGATLGYFTARWLVHRHTNDQPQAGLVLSPLVAPGAAGVLASLRF